MTDINKYLANGMIEDYCLGNLDPETNAEIELLSQQYPLIRKELMAVQDTLVELAKSFQKEPPAGTLHKILTDIKHDVSLEKMSLSPTGKLPQFIPISHRSDVKKWQHITRSLEPPEDFIVHVHELYSDTKSMLSVLWIKERIPEEIHDTTLESIFLLEGTCSGTLADESVELTPGTFWDIPLYTRHSLKVTSASPAKLILMRRLVA